MTKFFNELLGLQSIIGCYINNEFPNAYCLLTNSVESVDILSTENTRLIETQNERLVRKDGTRIIIH